MGVDPVRRKQPLGSHPTKHGRKLRASGQRCFQATIGETEILSPLESENLSRRGRFASTNLFAAMWRRLAARQIENPNLPAGGLELDQRARRTKFDIVGMGRDEKS